MKKNYKKIISLILGLTTMVGVGYGQNLLTEDFSTATGTTPPTGWVQNDISGSAELWYFNNPGSRTLNTPITDPAAIFDSDDNGSGGTTSENTALESPVFDASTAPYIFLSFDHYFRGLAGGEYHVEVFDGAVWTEVAGGTATTNDPQHENIDITTACGGSTLAQVRFRWVGDWSWYWIVDNISIDVVTCPAPTALTAFNLTGFTADITWTEAGSATSWQVEYGTTGFTQGTGILSVESNDTVNLSTLTPVTTYDFYVRAICGPGDTSTWVGPMSFTTTCVAVIAPWTEAFENGGTIPTCWNQGTGNAEPWRFSNTPGSNHIGNSGTIVGATTSGGYFAWVDDSSPQSMGTTLESPLIDVSALTIPQLSFYLISNNEGHTNVDFSIDVFDGATWHVGFFTHNTNTLAGGWEKIIVNLSSLTFTGPMQLRFVVDETNSTDFYDDVAIDDIDIHEQPSCPDPTVLTLNNIYTDSAEITWTAGGVETAWNIQWGTPGFIPGTGVELGSSITPSTTYMITGLTPNTGYEVYVRAICGPGDSSAWVGPMSFTTTCTTETVPYVEDFTSGAMSNCWTTSDPSNVFVEATCGSRTNILRFDYSNDAITNVIDASAVPNSVKVSYYIAESVCGNGADAGETFEVSYWDGTQFVVAKTYDASRPDAYTHEYFLVPASVLTNAFQVKFEQISGTTDTWMIDSLVVEQGPSCFPVTALTVDSTTTDSIYISWTAGGLETTWNIEWGAPGYTPGAGTEIGSTTTSSNPYGIGGLTPSTSYDIYVQAQCSPTDSSFWVLVQGATDCATITALPWIEDFEAMSPVGAGIFPNCWTQELSATWHDDWETQTDGTNQYLAALLGNSDDYIWTPEFGLTAGVSYEFSFKYNGQGNAEWENYLLISPTGVSSDAVSVDTIVKFTETAENGYVKYKYCFTPDSTAKYHFGIQIDDNGFNNDFYFDDFMLQIPTTTIGVGGDTTICQTGGLIDLNSVITITNTDGSWMYFPNPTTIVNDTMFNPEFVPSGVQNVSYYTSKGCYPDTVTAAINIVSPASAGIDGTQTTCNYGVFNLFDGLTGVVTLGGQWYDPASQPITGSFVNFNGEIPASYNYIYIVDNTTCPGEFDTSIVEIVLTQCAGVDEYSLDGFNFYPNPTNGVVNIQYAGKGEDVQINVIDTKGAVVWTKQVQFADGTTQKVDLSRFDNGTYFINMRSKNGAKVMKVVKN